jgi:hypothetical protein
METRHAAYEIMYLSGNTLPNTPTPQHPISPLPNSPNLPSPHHPQFRHPNPPSFHTNPVVLPQYLQDFFDGQRLGLVTIYSFNGFCRKQRI